MDIKVSVILPSLNVAGYIRECIESAIAQTLKEIEIICVDAGSTDGTLEILEEYALKDDRIRIVHSQIKSYGYQMNLGIKLSKGSYIGILETDDWVEPEMYATLYEKAEKFQLDFAKADFVMFKTAEDGTQMHKQERLLSKASTDLYDQVISADEYPQLHFWSFAIWDGIYKKTFLEQYGITFNETPGAAFQDIGFLQQVLSRAKEVIYLRKVFYHYRLDREEASSNRPDGVGYLYQEYSRLLQCHLLPENLSEGHKHYLFARIALALIIEYNKALRYDGYPSGTDWRIEEYHWFYDTLKEAERRGYLKAKDYDTDIWLRIQLLLHSRRSYKDYAYVSDDIFSKKQEEIKRKVKKRKVIIFGCGVYGRSLYGWLFSIGASVEGFCDNDSRLWGQKIEYTPVYSPEKCAIEKKDVLYFIANKRYTEEIKKQLRALGIKEEDIQIYQPV